MATETERKFLVKGEFRHLAVKKISDNTGIPVKRPFKRPYGSE